MKESTVQLILGLLVGGRRMGPGTDWDEAFSETLRYRLGGLAWSLGPWPATVPLGVREGWEAAYRAQAVTGTLILEELGKLRSLFRDARVPLGAIKGGQLLESKLYPVGARAADDLDVVVPHNFATSAVELMVGAGWAPWSDDVMSTIGWCDSATFHMCGQGGALGLSVDLHWRTSYGRLRFGPDGSEPGGPPEEHCWPSPEDHLVRILEHFFKHLRHRTHLSALADALRVAREVKDWSRFESLVSSSAWGAPAAALLAGLEGAAGEHFLSPESRGRINATLRVRLEPARLVREAGRTRRRARGIASRWAVSGPGVAVRDLRDALLPPAAWLESRYAPLQRGPKALLWARHLSRLVRWGIGVAPSPLAPNQE